MCVDCGFIEWMLFMIDFVFRHPILMVPAAFGLWLVHKNLNKPDNQPGGGECDISFDCDGGD